MVKFNVSTTVSVQGESVNNKQAVIISHWMAQSAAVKLEPNFSGINSASNFNIKPHPIYQWMAVVTTPAESYFLYSLDEFKSAGRISFEIPTILKGESTNTCTKQLTSSVKLLDIVDNNNGFYILTDVGLYFLYFNNSVTWSLISKSCIKSMVPFQQSYISDYFWVPLILIGGNEDEGLLWYVNDGKIKSMTVMNDLLRILVI
jgi:hypothetical protein